jgi:hypothetical protein
MLGYDSLVLCKSRSFDLDLVAVVVSPLPRFLFASLL